MKKKQNGEWENFGIQMRSDVRRRLNVRAAELDIEIGDVIFLNGWLQGAFVKELRKASKLRIEAMFFREGSRVLEFDVAGLQWK